MSLTSKIGRDDIILLLIAMALNLLIIQFFCCSGGADREEYLQLGTNLSLGNGYAMETNAPFYPSAFRVPVYPLVIAAIIKLFGSVDYIYYLQVILNILSVFMVYNIARRHSPQLRPKIIIPLILIFSLPVFMRSARLETETVNAFLMVSAFYLLTRNKYFFTGLVFGLATLCRPENILIALVVAVCLWNVKHTLIVVTSLMLLVAPWLIRNYRILGDVTLIDSVSSNCNLVAGTFPADDPFEDPVYRRRVELTSGHVTKADRDAYATLARNTYFERWRANPFGVFFLKAKRLLRPIFYGLEDYAVGENSSWSFHSPRKSYPLIALRLLSMLLYGLVFFGLVALGIWRSKERRILFLVIPYAVMIIVGFVAYADHRHFILSRLLLIPLFIAGLSSFFATQADVGVKT